MITLEKVKEYLTEMCCKDTVILENPSYETAIIGISDDDRLIYDYDLMAEYLVNNDNMTLEEAYEFVDYNTIRALAYMGYKAPIIKQNLEL